MQNQEEIIEAPRYFIGDTETCGLPPNHQACQIGLLEFDPDTFDILWEIESLIDPEKPISPGAAAIHRITDDMVVDQPTLLEFKERDLEGGLPAGHIMVAHNYQFDEPQLTLLGPVAGSICTLREARAIKHLFPGLVDCKLQTLRAYFGFAENDAHQALADCQMTLLVLQKLCEASGKTVAQMAAVTDRTVHRMPFGKHEGALIIDLPTHYIQWMLNNTENLDVHLRTSLKNALALK